MKNRRSVLAVYLVVIAVGAFLTGIVHQGGNRVTELTDRLSADGLPTLSAISDLKLDMAALEPIVYEYALTGDRARFAAKRSANERRVTAELQRVRKAFPERAETEAIGARYDEIRRLVARLDQAIGQRAVSGDEVHALIASIGAACARINGQLDQFGAEITAQTEQAANVVRDETRGMLLWVGGFSAALVLVTLALGAALREWLREVAQRRRLAAFPERNPRPVFELSGTGAVTYANSGTALMLYDLSMPTCRSEALLPQDYVGRLAAMREIGAIEQEWEYPIGRHTLRASVHYLQRLDLFHAYLIDVTEQRAAQARLAHQAFHDPLTGLANRHAFMRDFAQAAQQGVSLHALIVNVDRFQPIVDGLGHGVADRLLQALAQRFTGLADRTRGHWTPYRFEGNQFAMLVRGSDGAGALAWAATLNRAMHEPIVIDTRRLSLGASIGAAAWPKDGEDAAAILSSAHAAAHEAWRRGGDGCAVFSQAVRAPLVRRMELESELHAALTQAQLTLAYQPQLDLASGEITGVEALMRWRHPTRGWISPAEFIPVAEESGLIVALGDWAMRRACAQIRAWQAGGNRALTVAVNVSPRQFLIPGLAERIAALVNEYGIEPRALEIEITESAAMQDTDHAVSVLGALKAIGIGVAIDDFGTGHSSLAWLKRLPFDKLKIDRSFVADLGADRHSEAIVRTIIALARALGLRVLAEGAETGDQYRRLVQLGCDAVQGRIVSAPIEPEWLEALVRRHARRSEAAPRATLDLRPVPIGAAR